MLSAQYWNLIVTASPDGAGVSSFASAAVVSPPSAGAAVVSALSAGAAVVDAEPPPPQAVRALTQVRAARVMAAVFFANKRFFMSFPPFF